MDGGVARDGHGDGQQRSAHERGGLTCAGCHDSAAALARRSLLMQGAILTGKINQRPVADFLRRHGGLAATEVAPMVTTLRRVLAETGGGG